MIVCFADSVDMTSAQLTLDPSGIDEGGRPIADAAIPDDDG